MIRPLLILISVAVAGVSSLYGEEMADSAVDILRRLDLDGSMIPEMTPMAFSNPAFRQWEKEMSISSIDLKGKYSGLNRAIDPRQGEGESIWNVGARTFMKQSPRSALWGEADYSAGKRRRISWNESADYDLIYPYVVADSIGGDLSAESYFLSGGYGGSSDRWAWGGEISYRAAVEYRTVDPRPRNVTGRLDLAAGGAWRPSASDYFVGVSLRYMKYRQSSDLQFVNDLADNRIWHLTGLGTHYERFAGQGYSHSYSGRSVDAAISIYPRSHKGLNLTAAMGRFTFDHLLNSLNRLPLQSASETRIAVELSWIQPGKFNDFAVTLSALSRVRKGREGIFGDAASGIYPLIDRLEMYRDNVAEISLKGLWQYHRSRLTSLCLVPKIGYTRDRQTYVDPWRRMIVGGFTTGIDAVLRRNSGRKWSWRFALDADCFLPSGCSLIFPNDPAAPTGMQQVELQSYAIGSRFHCAIGGSVDLIRAVSSKYAVGLTISYHYHSFRADVRLNDVRSAISFYF